MVPSFRFCISAVSRFVLGSVVILGLANSISTIAAEPVYRVVDTLHLDGGVKWDYLSYDADSHRLFITRGDHVDVLDTSLKQIVGSIPNTNGVHGVALVKELDRGFTSNGKDNTVTAFELSTLKPLGTVPTGKKPDAIVYDPASKLVFVANGESASLTVIDPANIKNVGSVTLAGEPEFAVVDGKGRLFVNLEDKNQVAVVDTRKLTVTARYDLSSVCNEPAGLAIDLDSQRLFVSCANQKLAVVDGNSGKVISNVPIGKFSDGVFYDSVLKLAFSSNGDGTLTVIGPVGPNKYGVKQVVNTKQSAKTMVLDPVSHRIYLGSAEVAQPTEKKQARKPSLKENSFALIVLAPQ